MDKISLAREEVKTIFFDWHDFEQEVVDRFEISLHNDIKLSPYKFDLQKALGFEAISVWPESNITNLDLDEMHSNGLKKIFARSAGYNNIPVQRASELGVEVFRVAAYSPESIAEHSIGMMLSLSRKLMMQRENHKIGNNNREVKQMGSLLNKRRLGIYGYGRIGQALAKIARDGFGMEVFFYDPYFKNKTVDTKVKTLQELFDKSEIVSIHTVLNEETKNSVNRKIFNQLDHPVMLINASRGGVVHSEDIVEMLYKGKISALGVDVWGEDDKFDERLLREDAIQTAHVAFFTEEAVKAIIIQTLESWNGRPRKENIVK